MTDFFPNMDDLLDHHAANDAAVIEIMIRAYNAPIHRLCASVLHDVADADDAVQETFIKAALHLDRYRTGTNFKGWLYAIAINVCRGLLRKRKTRTRLQLLVAQFASSAFGSPVAEEQVIRMEDHSRLKIALNTLKEKHRLPVVLRFVHGLPIAEIAQILGVREGTVHSRLHYAIKKLKLELESENHPMKNPQSPISNLEYPISK